MINDMPCYRLSLRGYKRGLKVKTFKICRPKEKRSNYIFGDFDGFFFFFFFFFLKRTFEMVFYHNIKTIFSKNDQKYDFQILKTQ